MTQDIEPTVDTTSNFRRSCCGLLMRWEEYCELFLFWNPQFSLRLTFMSLSSKAWPQ